MSVACRCRKPVPRHWHKHQDGGEEEVALTLCGVTYLHTTMTPEALGKARAKSVDLLQQAIVVAVNHQGKGSNTSANNDWWHQLYEDLWREIRDVPPSYNSPAELRKAFRSQMDKWKCLSLPLDQWDTFVAPRAGGSESGLSSSPSSSGEFGVGPSGQLKRRRSEDFLGPLSPPPNGSARRAVQASSSPSSSPNGSARRAVQAPSSSSSSSSMSSSSSARASPAQDDHHHPGKAQRKRRREANSELNQPTGSDENDETTSYDFEMRMVAYENRQRKLAKKSVRLWDRQLEEIEAQQRKLEHMRASITAKIQTARLSSTRG